jgi:hypothetical protein
MNKTKNAIIRVNRKITFVNASPKIADLSKSSFRFEFLKTPISILVSRSPGLYFMQFVIT